MNHIIEVTLAEDGDVPAALPWPTQPAGANRTFRFWAKRRKAENWWPCAGRHRRTWRWWDIRMPGMGWRRSLQNPPVGTAGSQAADPHHLGR